MPHKPMPSQAYLREILDYDPATGIFRWKSRPNYPSVWNTRYAGQIAGSTGQKRCRIFALGKHEGPFLASRLAWSYVYGVDPSELQVDHIDRDPTNNKITNLRLATSQQQKINMVKKTYRGEKLKRPYPGVKQTSSGKFSARTRRENKEFHCGVYDTAEEARDAYIRAVMSLHGDFIPV